eukprot:690189-Amphidinium_carterae.1
MKFGGLQYKRKPKHFGVVGGDPGLSAAILSFGRGTTGRSAPVSWSMDQWLQGGSVVVGSASDACGLLGQS